MTNNASFYEQAAREADEGDAIAALWAKTFADANGSEARAKVIYIRLRVADLSLSRDKDRTPSESAIAAATSPPLRERGTDVPIPRQPAPTASPSALPATSAPNDAAERFDVVLDGTTLHGQDITPVAIELAKLIKRDTDFAIHLLRGQPTKLRSGVDAATSAR